MNTSQYMHWFISGLFVAAALSQSVLISIILAVILLIIWGNYTLPLLLALFIDVTFLNVRVISNLFGFTFTISALVLTVILLPLRKFLKF